MAKPRPFMGDGADVKFETTTYGDFYTGTKEALIASGKCHANWFPSDIEYDKQGRIKRTYKVECNGLSVTLTHRLDAKGQRYWIAQFQLDPEEENRRNEQYRQEEARERAMRETREREIREALPTVLALRERYPGVRIEGQVNNWGKRRRRDIEFFATLETLKRLKLVTDQMLGACDQYGGYSGNLRAGTAYRLSPQGEHTNVWRFATFTELGHATADVVAPEATTPRLRLVVDNSSSRLDAPPI